MGEGEGVGEGEREGGRGRGRGRGREGEREGGRGRGRGRREREKGEGEGRGRLPHQQQSGLSWLQCVATFELQRRHLPPEELRPLVCVCVCNTLMCCELLQWNLSNQDTNGAEGVSLLVRCPHFRG